MGPSHIPSKPWTDLGCSPTDLVKVVGAVVRGDTGDLVEWLRESTDASQVVEMLAARHRAGPFLRSQLQGTSAWEALPEAARARLLKSEELQSAAAKVCLQHLVELDDLFGSLALPFIALKGPELGVRFGRGPASRGYRDVDILVKEADRRVACRGLEEAGCHRLSRHFLGASASARFNHACDYSKAGRPLDMHWCVSRLPGVRINDGLFHRAQALSLEGRTFNVLCPSDELTVLLLSSFADIQRGYLRLQPFVDVFMVARALPSDEWEDFFAARRQERTDSICRAVLHLVVSIFSLQGSIPGLDAHLPAIVAPGDAMQVLLPSPGGRVAKRWALRHLPVGLVHYATWWVVSLPFRAAASHPRLRRGPSQPAINSANRAISGLA